MKWIWLSLATVLLQSCRTSPPPPQVFQFNDTLQNQYWAKQNHSIESKMQTEAPEFDLPQFVFIAKKVAEGTEIDSSKLAKRIAKIYKPKLIFDSVITSDSAIITLHISVEGDKIKTDLDVWNLLTEKIYKQTQTIAKPEDEPSFMGTANKLITYIVALIMLCITCYIVFFKRKQE